MIKKTKLALSIATAVLTMTSTLASTDALAHKKHHHHAKKHHAHSTTTYTRRTTSYVTDSSAKVDALEAQLMALQAEVNSLRAESSHTSSSTDTMKVQELDQWMTSVKSGRASTSSKDNMMFFRGGFSRATDASRGGWGAAPGGTLYANGGTGASGDPLVGDKIGQDAWYFGAGFDFSLNNDLFGLMNGTQVLAELLVDYKEFSDKTYSVVTAQNVTTNQLTIGASPKIKLFKGQAFRPWIIPVGFEMSVISPPSGAVTVLNPGIQFGVGADYKIWKDLYVGADARYHYSADNIDGVDTDGVTAGGYLGIGF